MPAHKTFEFDYRAFIARHGGGQVLTYGKGQAIYRQGEPSDALYYLASGSVKISVMSEAGKEAVIALLRAGTFFGESCLDGHPIRTSAVTAANQCTTARLTAASVIQAFTHEPEFSRMMMDFLVERMESLKADLIDQMFNSTERRLARMLVMLANVGAAEQPKKIPVAVDHETLAKMVGTTRPRISAFMSKFRKMGYIEYNGEIKVHSSLLNVVLR